MWSEPLFSNVVFMMDKPQSSTWVEVREAVPSKQSTLGRTVAAHMCSEVSQDNKGLLVFVFSKIFSSQWFIVSQVADTLLLPVFSGTYLICIGDSKYRVGSQSINTLLLV